VRVKAPNRWVPSSGKVLRLHEQEAAAARRRWLLTAGALLLALIVGILIGRYLLP
jgi:hypothetical protein